MKIIFEILLAGAVASLAATACGDMDSIHEQYSGRPEKIYIGRVDSLKAHGGLSQLRSQPQGNAVAPLLLRLTELAADGVPVHQAAHVVVVQHLDLLDLMRCTETIKEVDEWNFALDCC